MSARRRLSFRSALVVASVAALTVAALPAASAANTTKLPPGIVTFAVNQPDRIFLAGVTGGGHTCTFASGGVTSFGWSPDGSRLVFSRVDDGPPDTADLYVTNSTGGHAGGKFRELTNNGKDGTFDRLPAWSPDGRSIAFTRASGPQGSRRSVIVRMRSDGTRLREVASPPVVDGVQTTDYWPSFSPDGKYVAFVRERATAADLVVAGPRGGVRALTRDGKSARDGYGWAPTGHSIVFVRGTHLEDADLFVVDVSTRRVRRLTHDRIPKFTPKWSPDGKRIAYEQQRGRNIDAVSIDPNGGSRRSLEKPHGRALNPTWSTDSRFVAYYVFPPSGTPLENSLDELGRIEVRDVATRHATVLFRGKVNDVPLGWQPTPKLSGKPAGLRKEACRGGLRVPPASGRPT
jgi:Tol biopolymer transport system component